MHFNRWHRDGAFSHSAIAGLLCWEAPGFWGGRHWGCARGWPQRRPGALVRSPYCCSSSRNCSRRSSAPTQSTRSTASGSASSCSCSASSPAARPPPLGTPSDLAAAHAAYIPAQTTLWPAVVLSPSCDLYHPFAISRANPPAAARCMTPVVTQKGGIHTLRHQTETDD